MVSQNCLQERPLPLALQGQVATVQWNSWAWHPIRSQPEGRKRSTRILLRLNWRLTSKLTLEDWPRRYSQAHLTRSGGAADTAPGEEQLNRSGLNMNLKSRSRN